MKSIVLEFNNICCPNFNNNIIDENTYNYKIYIDLFLVRKIPGEKEIEYEIFDIVLSNTRNTELKWVIENANNETNITLLKTCNFMDYGNNELGNCGEIILNHRDKKVYSNLDYGWFCFESEKVRFSAMFCKELKHFCYTLQSYNVYYVFKKLLIIVASNNSDTIMIQKERNLVFNQKVDYLDIKNIRFDKNYKYMICNTEFITNSCNLIDLETFKLITLNFIYDYENYSLLKINGVE